MDGFLDRIPPEIFVGISLLVFFGLLAYFKVHRRVAAVLDGHAEAIQKRLEEARKLSIAARESAADADFLVTGLSDIRKEKLEQAKLEAELSAKAALADFEAVSERRLQAAKERLVQAEIAASKKIRNQATGIAIEVATEIANANLSKAARSKFADRGIKKISSRFPRQKIRNA